MSLSAGRNQAGAFPETGWRGSRQVFCAVSQTNHGRPIG
jgi:hypothetical protein